jgi:hypothetical protein
VRFLPVLGNSAERMDSLPSDLSRQRYEERRGEVRLHLSHFLVRYLNDLYKIFEGDLAMAIVLGEISHHNTAPFFSPEKSRNEPVRVFQGDPGSWSTMEGCNAYSISCSTGIPRETVRRKIVEMKKRGWLNETPSQGLRITQACADHFGPDFTLRILGGMLRASRIIEGLLAEPAEGGKPEPIRPDSRPQPERAAAKPAGKAISKTTKKKKNQ